jgi:hypothetical protein
MIFIDIPGFYNQRNSWGYNGTDPDREVGNLKIIG